MTILYVHPVLSGGGTGIGAPGGSPTNIQYNNNGIFGGISGSTFDGSTLFIPASSDIGLQGSDGVGTSFIDLDGVAYTAQLGADDGGVNRASYEMFGSTGAVSWIMTGQLNVNSDPGIAGQVLTSSGPGIPPIWSAAGSGAPGGGDGQVQFNNAGSFDGFGSFNGTTGNLTVTLSGAGANIHTEVTHTSGGNAAVDLDGSTAVAQGFATDGGANYAGWLADGSASLFQITGELVLATAVDAAAGNAGTLGTAPTAGDPAIWVTFKIGGNTYAFPAWGA